MDSEFEIVCLLWPYMLDIENTMNAPLLFFKEIKNFQDFNDVKYCRII